MAKHRVRGGTVGKDLNNDRNFFIPTVDYVRTKYDGVDGRIQRVILKPYYQSGMQKGTRNLKGM